MHMVRIPLWKAYEAEAEDDTEKGEEVKEGSIWEFSNYAQTIPWLKKLILQKFGPSSSMHMARIPLWKSWWSCRRWWYWGYRGRSENFSYGLRHRTNLHLQPPFSLKLISLKAPWPALDRVYTDTVPGLASYPRNLDTLASIRSLSSVRTRTWLCRPALALVYTETSWPDSVLAPHSFTSKKCKNGKFCFLFLWKRHKTVNLASCTSKKSLTACRAAKFEKLINVYARINV